MEHSAKAEIKLFAGLFTDDVRSCGIYFWPISNIFSDLIIWTIVCSQTTFNWKCCKFDGIQPRRKTLIYWCCCPTTQYGRFCICKYYCISWRRQIAWNINRNIICHTGSTTKKFWFMFGALDRYQLRCHHLDRMFLIWTVLVTQQWILTLHRRELFRLATIRTINRQM